MKIFVIALKFGKPVFLMYMKLFLIFEEKFEGDKPEL